MNVPPYKKRVALFKLIKNQILQALMFTIFLNSLDGANLTAVIARIVAIFIVGTLISLLFRHFWYESIINKLRRGELSRVMEY
jgi:hypothetical protein